MIRWLALFVSFAIMPAAHAQATSCRLPDRLPRPTAEGASAESPRRLLPIGGYTLALSWSPAYCRGRERSAADRLQCSGAAARFGFILHGLWPDGLGKAWPQYCRPVALLPEALLRRHLCETPSVQLLQHQWAKHGSCATTDPARYLAAGARAYRQLRYPDMAALSRIPMLSRQRFAAAFAAANPGMQPDMLRLKVDSRGWLEEVWLCLGRDLAARACPNAKRHGGGPLRIWRG